MKDGQRRGPYQPFRLVEMLEDGELTARDAVWHEGMEKWQPLEDTESLRTVLRKGTTPPHPDTGVPVPPPLPPAGPPELTLALLRQRRALAWRRFFARQIDLTLAAILVAGGATAFGWTDMWMLYMPEAFFYLIAPALLWILPEAVMLSTWGTTPGRLVLALRVLNSEDRRPAFLKALKRSVLVWAGGLGFGLPADKLLPVAQWMFSFWHFQRSGETLWDRSAGTHVTAGRLHTGHAAGIALITALVTSLFSWLWLMAPLPDRVKGEERAQFEELRHRLWETAAPLKDNSSLPSAPGTPNITACFNSLIKSPL